MKDKERDSNIYKTNHGGSNKPWFSERIKKFSEAEEIGERFPLPAWKAKIRKAFIPSCSRTKGLPDQCRCFIKKRQSVHLFANQHTKIQQANH